MFFPVEAGPVAIFTFPNVKDGIFSAVIMDLSPGGLGLTLKKGETLIKPGDSLILTEIKGAENLASVKNLETEIKWIQSFKAFKHILFGCEFTNISELLKEEIQAFIDLWSL